MIEANPVARFYGMEQLWVSDLGGVRWEKVDAMPGGEGERNSTTFHAGRIHLEDQPLTLYTIFDGKGTIFVNLHWKKGTL